MALSHVSKVLLLAHENSYITKDVVVVLKLILPKQCNGHWLCVP